jgi:hypothetical protein
MKLLVSLLLVTMAATDSSCEAVYEHTLSLIPDAMKTGMADKKADAIAKCEKLSPEARKCALDASSLEDLMKCPRK